MPEGDTCPKRVLVAEMPGKAQGIEELWQRCSKGTANMQHRKEGMEGAADWNAAAKVTIALKECSKGAARNKAPSKAH
eukprot:1159895-Pelagomonas_calceolata.AAC.3